MTTPKSNSRNCFYLKQYEGDSWEKKERKTQWICHLIVTGGLDYSTGEYMSTAKWKQLENNLKWNEKLNKSIRCVDESHVCW